MSEIMDDYYKGFLDGQKSVQKQLDKLKNLRAITLEDLDKEKRLKDCLENQAVFDESGDFTPYSTIINDIETHNALCEFSSKRMRENKSYNYHVTDDGVVEKL